MIMRHADFCDTWLPFVDAVSSAISVIRSATPKRPAHATRRQGHGLTTDEGMTFVYCLLLPCVWRQVDYDQARSDAGAACVKAHGGEDAAPTPLPGCIRTACLYHGVCARCLHHICRNLISLSIHEGGGEGKGDRAAGLHHIRRQFDRSYIWDRLVNPWLCCAGHAMAGSCWSMGDDVCRALTCNRHVCWPMNALVICRPAGFHHRRRLRGGGRARRALRCREQEGRPAGRRISLIGEGRGDR